MGFMFESNDRSEASTRRLQEWTARDRVEREAAALAAHVAAAQDALDCIPRFRRSWAEAEIAALRASLPTLAAQMKDVDQLIEHVLDKADGAIVRNRKGSTTMQNLGRW